MEQVNQNSNQTMEKYQKQYGFVHLNDFKKQYIQEARDSVVMPEYSANKEFDRDVVRLLKEGFDSDPESMLLKMNKALRQLSRIAVNSNVLSYRQDRETYLAVVNAAKVLGIKYIPATYSYTTNDPGYVYNAFAIGYGNNINIFLSQYLFGEVLADFYEKTFIIGHELGHNQANHTGRFIVKETKRETMLDSRYGEYTADRAGLLACQNVEAAAAALVRIHENGTVKNRKELTDKAKELVANAETKVLALKKQDEGTHPCPERRIAAMKVFASSKMYAKLTGKTVEDSMLSDKELDNSLEAIIRGGK